MSGRVRKIKRFSTMVPKTTPFTSSIWWICISFAAVTERNGLPKHAEVGFWE